MGTIDANGEREIGELITKTMEKFDKEGVITIDVSKNTLKELTLMHSIILWILSSLFLMSIGKAS